jgi:hypothetical protein
MSKKYIPTFLKDTHNDYNSSKPLINTSLPAKETTKLIPATLASITSNTLSNTSSNYSTTSFAYKFNKQNIPTSNHHSSVKPINIDSKDDFPSLGIPKKSTTSNIWNTKNNINVLEKTSFADKVKQITDTNTIDDKNTNIITSHTTDNNIPFIRVYRPKKHRINDYDNDDEYNNNYDDSSLGSDSYEVPEDDDDLITNEDDEIDYEFNQNVEWDGRHKDDLY